MADVQVKADPNCYQNERKLAMLFIALYHS